MKTKITLLVLLLLTLFLPLHLAAQNYLKKFISVGEMVKLNDHVLFTANDGVHGLELWKSDGTAEGTVLLKDIATGHASSNASSFTVYKGEVYFAASNEIYGNELWKSDGTEAGTVLLKDIKPFELNNDGSSPKSFVHFKDELYFLAAETGINNFNLWKTDGTDAGTVKVYTASPMTISGLTPAGDILYFTLNQDNQLWKTDGTPAGTKKVFNDPVEYQTLAALTGLNTDLYFISHTSYRRKIRLYKLSAGSDTPLLLQSYEAPTYGSINFDNVTPVNSTLFFSIRTDFQSGTDTDVLWKTNGTPEGTAQIKSFDWEPYSSSSNAHNFSAVNGKLVFSAKATSGYSGQYNLWASDGTAAGTRKLSDVLVDNVTPFVKSEGKVFFNANFELWWSDGTASGTKVYADENKSNIRNPQWLFDMEGTLYYTAYDGSELVLWNNLPQPEIYLSSGYRSLDHAATLQITSKADSIVVHNLRIQNLGKKELTFSEIYVSGSDFYVDGSLSRNILPGKDATIRVIYFPSKAGKSYGALTLLNNDLNEGKYIVKLEGEAKAASGKLVKNVSAALNRAITFTEEASKIALDNSTIAENIPHGSLVGRLSVIDAPGDYTFSLVAGTGDTDNLAFTVAGNTLTTARSVNYEQKNTYTIRVKATGQTQSFEQALLIRVLNAPEDVSYAACNLAAADLSYSLHDVAFLDNQKVFAIGTGGVILKSENGGKDWTEITSGVTVTLRNLEFADARTGYIVGDYNTMLKTENGGEDWFLLELPDPSYPYINNFHFITADVGYVFGGGGKVFRTLDGGRSWITQTPTLDDLSAGYFIDDKKGFICGSSNTLIKTNNGGKDWERLNMSQFGWAMRFTDITFVTDRIGYILAQNGDILKTTDTGASWTTVGSARTDYATRFYFLNENEGYVVGGWSSTAFYKTMDGGVTWTYEPYLGSGTKLGISFSKDRQRACIVGLGTTHGSAKNSGRTIIIKEPGADWTLKSILEPADFRAAHFANDRTGYVFGTKSFKTEDGGITWKKMVIGNEREIGGYAAVSEDLLFVYNSDAIFKSVDEGKSWEQVFTMSVTTAAYLTGLHFLDAQNGFAYGGQNEMYKTDNGGRSWTVVHAPVSYAVNSMHFADSNTGYAVGSYGELIKTTDKGRTWALAHTFDVTWLQHVYFFNSRIGFVAGNNGALFKTTDGGSTWSKLEIHLGLNITNIKFTDELTGYAATSNNGGLGNFYTTADGGLTWTVAFQTEEMFHIGLTGSAVFVAGWRGMFKKLDKGQKATIPGYIRGETEIAERTRIDYYVHANSSMQYTWSVDPPAPINYTNNTATVNWENPGVYKLRVTAYNSCGWAEPREETIVVHGLPAPEIVGSESVSPFKTNERYYTKLNQNSRYSWIVEGHKGYTVNNNEVIVTWGDKGKGKVEVIETFHNTGFRKQAIKHITVLDATGLKESVIFKSLTVFPNPTEGMINIELRNEKRQPMEVSVIDAAGRTYSSYKFDKQHDFFQSQLNLSSLPKGFYLLVVRIGSEKAIRKIIKA